MNSRVVHRDKNSGQGALRAKSRVVLSGFRDPDLHKLPRYNLVATRAAFMLVLQVCVCVSNSWSLVSADIQTAFLQGLQNRDIPLYMGPPQDPLCKKSKVFPVKLYRVVGNVYGLASRECSTDLWCQ
eukprot:5748042-Amphidinium_carterae.1